MNYMFLFIKHDFILFIYVKSFRFSKINYFSVELFVIVLMISFDVKFSSGQLMFLVNCSWCVREIFSARAMAIQKINVSFKIGNGIVRQFKISYKLLSLTKTNASALLSDYMVDAHWSPTSSDITDVIVPSHHLYRSNLRLFNSSDHLLGDNPQETAF